MSLKLVRALRAAYDDVDGSETGRPSRAAVGSIATALYGQPEILKVAVLWSAARAIISPQVLPGAVVGGLQAIGVVQKDGAAGPLRSTPAEAAALLAPVVTVQASNEEVHVQAQACLGHAIAFCFAPEPARFMLVMDALVGAQRSEFARPARAKQAWIGWLDDVATRSDRFTVAMVLELLERALRGTLDALPAAFEWEGTADESGQLSVWAVDPSTRRLLRTVMRAKPLELAGDTLRTTILDEPGLVRDLLRIEYFIEHVIHRRFLGDMYAGRYRQIEYRCLGTGETWQAPA